VIVAETISGILGKIIMQLAEGFGDTIRIKLDALEQQRPFAELVAAMRQYLADTLGAEQAAEYEHVTVNDPGFAHFRRIAR
jgi:hypothetical protein